MKRMLFLVPPAQTTPVQTPTAPATVAKDTIAIAPSDDVWVYPHASDPGRDETFRVWGAGGRSVAADPIDAEDFAYGYLRFALPARLRGARIVGATLELTNVPNEELDADATSANPIEVRPLVGTFDEKSWNHAEVAKTHPDGKMLWGRGVPTFGAKEAPIRISVDLLARPKDATGEAKAGETSEFERAFPLAFRSSADGDGQIALALTSAVDASMVGMRRIYKIYTKETSDESRRPRLVLRIADGG